jgi:hypothetical protein
VRLADQFFFSISGQIAKLLVDIGDGALLVRDDDNGRLVQRILNIP